MTQTLLNLYQEYIQELESKEKYFSFNVTDENFQNETLTGLDISLSGALRF